MCQHTIFQLKSDTRENWNLRDFSCEITRISRVGLHEFSCDSHKFSRNFSCRITRFFMWAHAIFWGIFKRKIVYFYMKFYTIFCEKITEKSCEKPRKIMWGHTKTRVTLHEKLREKSYESRDNSWRVTREIRVISHEISCKLQFFRVSLFNWKIVCWHMIFYVISYDKSCTAFLQNSFKKRGGRPKKHLLFVLLGEVLFMYVSNYLLKIQH